MIIMIVLMIDDNDGNNYGNDDMKWHGKQIHLSTL